MLMNLEYIVLDGSHDGRCLVLMNFEYIVLDRSHNGRCLVLMNLEYIVTANRTIARLNRSIMVLHHLDIR